MYTVILFCYNDLVASEPKLFLRVLAKPWSRAAKISVFLAGTKYLNEHEAPPLAPASKALTKTVPPEQNSEMIKA